MRKIKSVLMIIVMIVVVLLIQQTSYADGFVLGSDGYYWYGSKAYTRHWNGYQWCYKQHHIKEVIVKEPVVVQKVVEDYDVDSQIRDLIQARKKRDKEIHAEEMARILFPDGEYSSAGGGQSSVQPYAYSSQSLYQKNQSIAQQGATQYGYGFSQQAYSQQTDPTILLNQMGNALETAGRLFEKSYDGTEALTRQQQSTAEKVATMQMVVALIHALKDEETLQTVTQAIPHDPASNGNQSNAGSDYSDAQALVNTYCLKCHDGQTSGAADYSDYASLSVDVKGMIVDAIYRSPPNQMPKSGSPQLNQSQKLVFLSGWERSKREISGSSR